MMAFLPQRVAVVTFLLAMGRLCLAQPSEDTGVDPEILKAMDANGDGKLSLDEFQKAILTMADSQPVETDSTIEEDHKFKAFLIEGMPIMFKLVDDGDGFLSGKEASDMMRRFHELIRTEMYKQKSSLLDSNGGFFFKLFGID
eukprot:TRINITY_DN12539_c0_g4_i1.p1 TRINITY_DN12539_c0_g4~~TRINITY_DN12539_c0_g4_i1.p1  ORF type:complete len:143 (-),score=29.69 TRINITY_DN12539_c0_g4_i1:137-565(-)